MSEEILNTRSIVNLPCKADAGQQKQTQCFVSRKGEFIMDTPKVFESEYRFCLILWEHEPIKSSELVNLCKEKLGWKPTTTYTVIKRLSQRGVLKNENTVVTSLVNKDDVQAAEIDDMVEKKFEGSIPAFIAAFTRHQKLSEKEIDEVQQMIDRFRKENMQ